MDEALKRNTLQYALMKLLDYCDNHGIDINKYELTSLGTASIDGYLFNSFNLRHGDREIAINIPVYVDDNELNLENYVREWH